jgi:hypothetical protein
MRRPAVVWLLDCSGCLWLQTPCILTCSASQGSTAALVRRHVARAPRLWGTTAQRAQYQRQACSARHWWPQLGTTAREDRQPGPLRARVDTLALVVLATKCR